MLFDLLLSRHVSHYQLNSLLPLFSMPEARLFYLMQASD